MNTTARPIAFDRELYQALPNPLAHAYRKTYNSPTAKELHDNACHFGLCLLRFLAAVALGVLRDLRVALTPEEHQLLAKTDRPAEGDWHRWLGCVVQQTRQLRLPASAPGALLDTYLHARREAGSEVPGTLGQLLSHLDKKPIVRKETTALEFLLVLIRYRNDTIGHGAVLPENLNKAHGEAIERAIAELAGLLPWRESWELKYVAQSALGPTAVECHLIHLMGPDWLREPPVAFPRGYAAPLAGHVVLLPKMNDAPHLDLHPLLVFDNGLVLFFDKLRGKNPNYLAYDSGQKVNLEGLTQDYQDWKASLGAATQGPLPEATVLPKRERFRLERLLGRGGMGEVWLAYDESLKRQVAIKRVRGDWLGRTDIERRFLQEARSAARLSHPNILPILSIDSDDQGIYLVLEYLEGGSLRHLLEQGPLQLPVALAYLRQLLQALEEAHEEGLIHRDVKPENILLTKAGVPKIADFGLAWVLQDRDEANARGQAAAEGTATYLAPELARGEEPSPRSDLYSLGLTFYEMLTSRPPHRVEEKRVPSDALPLLRKLIHPDPNLRFASAAQALRDCQDLERALELAGRTAEETSARINRTADEAFGLLRQSRPIDAQACFVRILAEDPGHVRAQTGMLFVHLLDGDMEKAAARYQALVALHPADELFGRFQAFVEAIRAPTVLHLTPQPMTYSYRIEDLRQGRFVKELVEVSADTINVGDIGEVLVELAQKRRGGQAAYSLPAPNDHRLSFALDRVQVEIRFRIHIKPKVFFFPARLLAADATLTITAEPFETYRFVRYLTSILTRRFKRAPSDWIRAEAARHFGLDVTAALADWERLACDIQKRILLPSV